MNEKLSPTLIEVFIYLFLVPIKIQGKEGFFRATWSFGGYTYTKVFATSLCFPYQIIEDKSHCLDSGGHRN
jgi:hypothetical protein